MPDGNALAVGLDFTMSGLQEDRRAELRAENEEYLRQHPEVNQLLNDFVSSCLVQQPVDVFGFARDYFRTTAAQPKDSR